ncbi:MAG TPA: sarcosine oxidase subunit alpha family protein [Steroidobacteraceae bacterium]|nr:sarcosine oxidase subunit alpha family protein [Steroidobacteraceae bacterium]
MSGAGGKMRTPSGGRIDRSRPLTFTFDGRSYSGFQGDTLASALLANDVHLVGRSFKYHRPRGIFSAGAEEPNALVGVRRDANRYTPNLRATQIELYEGLRVESQNRWPSLSFDTGAVNDALAPFIPAGFYYKTFMWPRGGWERIYEPRIRAAAGLGHAPHKADPDRYTNRFAHCDVLIVGAGPAGLAAALAASRSGARVILCDEQPELGGSLLSDAATGTTIDGQPSLSWLRSVAAELTGHPAVTVLTRTTAFGYFPHNLIGLNERLTDHLASLPPHLPRERTWQVRAREVVLATGAIERPLVFPGNDRPGVMLASAARTYVNRYGVVPGSRAVVVAASDEAYRAAIDLHAAGIEIAAVVDVREHLAGELPAAARSAGIEIQTGTTVVGTSGRLRVRSVHVARIDSHGDVSGGSQSIACDLVLMSGGLTPTVHLFSQSRGKLDWDEELQAFIPGAPAERTRALGACRGVFDLAAILGSAHSVATLNAARKGFVGALPARPGSAKAFVDWQHDVTSRDLKLATREGFRSIEHIKRYTTTGMATDQGKTSNLNALAVVSREMDKPIAQVGLTTFRMPYTPVSFGSFAGLQRGDLFDPQRTTPTHSWAASRGAVFEDVGLWKRARYFPRGAEDMHAAVARECLAVRNSCGIFDASTLGKIEVVGKDAATFMNRMYVNAWSNLGIGKAKYGVLLRDDGFVYDDGVVARLAEDRFHLTTTTGGAARVLALMEDYVQTEWTELDVWLTSTTEQWSVIAVQGPNARKVIEPLVEGIDLSAAALPHMSVGRGTICGIPMLLFRVSFTGELGFEINVPADYGLPVWEAVYQAGQACGITEYGTESMHVLRAEKGYIIVGQDTDGTATPDDAGLAWAVGKSKEDFVGKRSLMRPAMSSPERKQLVGLATRDPRVVLEEGAQIAGAAGQQPPFKPLGHVTSAYHSAVLNRSIALAMVSGGRARLGKELYVSMPGGDIPVTVTSPVFYDPEGARLHG